MSDTYPPPVIDVQVKSTFLANLQDPDWQKQAEELKRVHRAAPELLTALMSITTLAKLYHANDPRLMQDIERALAAIKLALPPTE